MGNILILSDIHANLSALKSALKSVEKFNIDKLILLGDIIDYGMRPNETIRFLKNIPYDVILNLHGNHENSYLLQDYKRFSSDRGRDSLKETTRMLNNESDKYIKNNMIQNGKCSLKIADKNILFVHGNIDDEYWGKLDEMVDARKYFDYDIVVSGHSHISHYFTKSISEDNINKSITFINGGSIGQPRNRVPKAQFLIANETFDVFTFSRCEYDIEYEQSLYDGRIDEYYKNRLSIGV